MTAAMKWILQFGILATTLQVVSAGGWAYLSDEDARDGDLLARFQGRNLVAKTAAELFQSVIDESAKASYGATSKLPQQVNWDKVAATARKGGKGGKGSRGDDDSDDSATLRPLSSPVTTTPIAPTTFQPITPTTFQPIVPVTSVPLPRPVTGSPIVPVVRTTSSPVGKGKGGKGGKEKRESREADDDDDSSTPQPQTAPVTASPITPTTFQPVVPVTNTPLPPPVTGSPIVPVVRTTSSPVGKGSGEKKSSSEKGTRNFSKSEKKQESSSDACRDFEFDVDRRHRRLQFDGAGCSLNVLDLARQISEFSTFVGLVEEAGLEYIFECGGPFTALIPTNAALNNLDTSSLSADELRGVLLNHILPGVFLRDDFGPGSIEALNGSDVVVSVNPLQFNDAMATSMDNIACNGVVHAIDSVLVDIRAGDGVCRDLIFDSNGAGKDCSPSLVEVASQDSNLSLVVALIEQTGLSEFLACDGSFTVLLPTNNAILGLGTDTLQQLQDPTNFQVLRDLLLYHIIPGRAASDTIQAGQVATLLEEVSLVVTRNPLLFDNALVTSPDNPFCNGIYHVIDGVVIPPSDRPSGQTPTIQPSSLIVRSCDSFDFGGTDIACNPNVLTQAKTNLDLSLAVSLFELAGLSDIFDCAGQFTLLLPVNAAITELGQDRIEELLLPQNLAELQRILLAHVLPGRTLASEFSAGTVATLSPGSTVVVGLNPLTFTGTGVVSTDSIACNGVVHAIEGILMDPTPAPSVAPLIRVVVDRFYISYRTTSTTMPTAQEFDTNRQETLAYYENVFTSKYANFRGLDMDLDFNLSGDDVTIPAVRYNAYQEYSQAVFFFDSSGDIPSSDELFQVLEDGITTDYLLTVVRTQSGPFSQVVEAFLKYVL